MFRRFSWETLAIAGAYIFALMLWLLGFYIFQRTKERRVRVESSVNAQGRFNSIADCLTDSDIEKLEKCPGTDLFQLISDCGTQDMINRLEQCEN